MASSHGTIPTTTSARPNKHARATQSLKEQLEKFAAEQKKLESEKEKSLLDNQRFKREKEQFELEKARSASNLQRLEKENAGLIAVTTELATNLKQARMLSTHQTTSIEHLTRLSESNTTQISGLKTEIKEYTSIAQGLRTELLDRQQDASAKDEIIRQLQEQMARFKEEAQQHREQEAALLARSISDAADAKRRLDNLRESANTMTHSSNTSQRTAQRLTQRLKEKTQESTNKIAKLEAALVQQKADAQRQLDNQRKSSASMIQLLDASKSAARRLEKSFKEKTQESTNKIAKLEAALVQQTADAQRRLDNQRKSSASMIHLLDASKSTARRLKQRLEEQKRESATGLPNLVTSFRKTSTATQIESLSVDPAQTSLARADSNDELVVVSPEHKATPFLTTVDTSSVSSPKKQEEPTTSYLVSLGTTLFGLLGRNNTTTPATPALTTPALTPLSPRR